MIEEYELIGENNRLLLTHSSGFSYDFMNEGLMEWSQYIGKKPEMDTSMVRFHLQHALRCSIL